MKKLIKRPESEGDDVFEEVTAPPVLSITEYYDIIENLEENEPKDKRSREYKSWLSTLNRNMKEANIIAESKIYKIIK